MPKSINRRRRKRVKHEQSEDDSKLNNCRFLPLDVLDNMCDKYRNSQSRPTDKCRTSLLKLQRKALNYRPCHVSMLGWRELYNNTLSKAVCTQNWDELKYILLESPIWEHHTKSGDVYHSIDNYLKAVTILLMYHQSANTQSLMDELLHMVLSCRTDQDKAAFKKLLAAFPQKLVIRSSFMKAKGR